MNRIEKKLLRHGTSAGPVTQEMIDMAKRLHSEACKLTGLKEDKDGWLDFLPETRKSEKERDLIFS